MRVVFNRQSTLGSRTGIGHYASELLAALSSQLGPEEMHAYPTGWLWRLQCHFVGTQSDGGICHPTAMKTKSRDALNGPDSFHHSRTLSLGSTVRRALRGLQPLKFRHFAAHCRRQQFDLYHEPNILPMPCDCPTISTLHDLSAIAHPEWHPAYRVRQYERHIQRALAQCTHFLTGSDYTRQEIIRELGVAPQRVTRVYHGIRQGLAPMPAKQVAAGLKALGLPGAYLLHVGTLEPRKNLEMLVRAYGSLSDLVRQKCPLLLVGKWGWNTEELAELLRRQDRGRGVIHIGYIGEEHLPLLYNGARALVYPSLYEGFGLPPLEMMACGGAALVSSAGAVAEVVGGHGYQIDPNDVDGWREAMGRAIVDDDWLRMLRHGVRGWAAPFTWKRCAENTNQVYRQVLSTAGTQQLAA